jgi:hypothetical protein
VGFVQQHQQGAFDLLGVAADLPQELVFAPEGRFTEGTDQQSQQIVAGELRQVQIMDLHAGSAQFVPEAFEQG